MISFDCPHCGQKVNAKDIYAGREIHCPKCRQMIRIPSPAPGKAASPARAPSNAQSNIIKIRCPGCNQKIGVSKNYAGKTVKCAKCGTLMQVPTPKGSNAAPQPKTSSPIDQELDFDALLSPKETKTSPDDEADINEMLGGALLKDESVGGLLNLPADEVRQSPPQDEPLHLAPTPEQEKPIARVRCPKCGEMNPPEAGVCLICSNELPAGTGTAQRRGPTNIGRELVIGSICALIYAAFMGYVIFTFFSVFKQMSSKNGPLTERAKQTAEFYTESLKAGDTAGAKKLLIPSLQTSVTTEQMDSMTGLFKDKNVAVKFIRTNYEPNTQGDRYYLYYMVRAGKKTFRPLILSISEVDNELKIDCVATEDDAGGSVTIGPRSARELSEAVLLPLEEGLTGFLPALAKSCCAIVIAWGVLLIIMIASMWVVFDKAGQPGWAAIVPFYNMWVLAEVGEQPGWVGLASCLVGFIPYVGPLIGFGLSIFICINVAKAFERSVLFGLGLAFLPLVFYPVLAFGSD
ncbi:MAG: hypothetical protein JW749_10325 [Sedimentisphaerales bacterium]|nr:hypothetical protein [Sedimentisphaerales bacterium]